MVLQMTGRNMSNMVVDRGDCSRLLDLAKARALMAGRYHVSIADIKTVAKPALRHRILINYEGEAEGVDVDGLITKLLEEVRQGASV